MMSHPMFTLLAAVLLALGMAGMDDRTPRERLYAGARGARIGFHMLHRDDQVRVKQQLICPAEEKVVGRDEIVKGYEYRKGEYVVIEPDEIKKIEPKTAKAMEILEFVKSSDVDPVYFEASYYVAPEEAGRRPFALLARALRETNYVAVAKLTMHNREYTVFLRPHEGGEGRGGNVALAHCGRLAVVVLRRVLIACQHRERPAPGPLIANLRLDLEQARTGKPSLDGHRDVRVRHGGAAVDGLTPVVGGS